MESITAKDLMRWAKEAKSPIEAEGYRMAAERITVLEQKEIILRGELSYLYGQSDVPCQFKAGIKRAIDI